MKTKVKVKKKKNLKPNSDIKKLEKTEIDIKNLILFDSEWKKRSTYKNFSKDTIKRIGIYRDLVKNAIEDVMASMYPYCKQILGKKWDKTVADYIEKHPPKSPVLVLLAAEFAEYLINEKSIIKKYPYIGELAVYEWYETEVHNMEDEKKSSKKLRLNPVNKVCNFKYPIQEVIAHLEAGQIPKKISESSVSILIYRVPDNFEVKFFELSEATRVFVELIKRDYSKSLIVESLMEFYNIDSASKKEFSKKIDSLIQQLKKNKILL